MHPLEKKLFDLIRDQNISTEERLFEVKSVIAKIKLLAHEKNPPSLNAQLIDKSVCANGEKLGTPLGIAVENGQLLIVKELIKEGVDLDAADFTGLTPVMLAAWYGHTDIGKVLFQAKANLDLQRHTDWHSVTALMIAVEKHHDEFVRELLLAKANPNIKNKFNQTALNILMYDIDYKISPPIDMLSSLLEFGAKESLNTISMPYAKKFLLKRAAKEVNPKIQFCLGLMSYHEGKLDHAQNYFISAKRYEPAKIWLEKLQPKKQVVMSFERPFTLFRFSESNARVREEKFIADNSQIKRRNSM